MLEVRKVDGEKYPQTRFAYFVKKKTTMEEDETKTAKPEQNKAHYQPAHQFSRL